MVLARLFLLSFTVTPLCSSFRSGSRRTRSSGLPLTSRRMSSASTIGGEDTSTLTILGFGSLLSESSSRLTFPELENFRLARVPNYRRVFAHPASIFFQRKIANLHTLEMSSLSVEYVGEGYPGFLAAVFEVSNKDMMKDGVPSQAYLEREEEFNIVQVPYTPSDSDRPDSSFSSRQGHTRRGIICERSTDEEYLKRWGEERFREHYKQYGVDTIWGWDENSGLRPCAVYLRHCYLAAQSNGAECLDSFLDETFLVDRVTTIRAYLNQQPAVLEQLPPPELAARYSG